MASFKVPLSGCDGDGYRRPSCNRAIPWFGACSVTQTPAVRARLTVIWMGRLSGGGYLILRLDLAVEPTRPIRAVL